MKPIKLTLIITVLALLVVSTLSHAQRANQPGRKSPNAMVSQNIDTTVVTVEYGRPGVKERQIWGGLVPFNEVWRAGANEATTIEFSNDVKLNGIAVPAGKYSLFVLPTENSWKLILNKEAKQWGAYKYDASLDQVRIDIAPQEHPHVEWLMYYFDDVSLTSADLYLVWGELAGSVTISIE